MASALVVDCHSHLFPAHWAPLGRMPSDMFDVEALLGRQEEGGVTLSLISDPHIWYGELDLGEIERTREYNDFAAELTRAHPGRIAALGSVNPWRGEAQLAEARRALDELGLPGLAVATSDANRYLDAIPADFWDLVAERDVPVFLHPGGSVVGQEQMGEYRLAEVCGRPLDTTVTLARFILRGCMERHPGLKLLCAHAGGAIATVADRLDFGHELREYAPLGPWGEVFLSRPPSTFVEELYLDTVTYGPGPLRQALDRVGSRQVLFGSDNPPVPFPLSRSRRLVEKLGLGADEQAAVLGGNSRTLFGLS